MIENANGDLRDVFITLVPPPPIRGVRFVGAWTEELFVPVVEPKRSVNVSHEWGIFFSRFGHRFWILSCVGLVQKAIRQFLGAVEHILSTSKVN